MPTIRTTWWSAPAGSPSRKASPKPASASSSSPACRSAHLARRISCALRLSAQGWKTNNVESNIPTLDLLGQRLNHLADVLEVRIDGERAAVGFERVLVVAELLQDQTEAGQRAEMTRLARKHLAQVGKRVRDIVLEEVDGGALVPGFDIGWVDRDDSVEKLDGEIVVLVVGRHLHPAH